MLQIRTWGFLGVISLLYVCIPFQPVAASADVIGRLQWHYVQGGDTLVGLARRYKVGYDAMLRANPVMDIWLPEAGKALAVPRLHVLPDVSREGVTINLAERRLYLFDQGVLAFTAPIGIGREGWETPLATTTVLSKQHNPTWYPPASIREEAAQQGEVLPEKVPPGPDNPLGQYAVRLALPGYLVHGTNKPAGVGMRVSHGCIRLYPEDIEHFYQRVSVGMKVQIIDQPYKLGWQLDSLWLEAHPVAYSDSQQLDAEQRLLLMLKTLSGMQGVQIDWASAESALLRLDGIPVEVGRRSSQASP